MKADATMSRGRDQSFGQAVQMTVYVRLLWPSVKSLSPTDAASRRNNDGMRNGNDWQSAVRRVTERYVGRV